MESEVKLYLGDCLEILPTLPDNSVDAVITDPPYGARKKIANDNPRMIEGFISKIFMCLKDVCTSQLFFSYIRNLRYWLNTYSRWELNNILLWHKEFGGSTSNRFPWKTEYILWFVNGDYSYNPPMVDAKSNMLKGKKKKMTDLLEIPSINNMAKERTGHPTQKPLELMTLLVEAVSNPADTILDPFMGSGTTGVACVQTGRNFIGIEIEPKYYDIAEKRIKEAQLQLRMPI